MKTEYLHSKFPSQTEMIGHLYDRAIDDDEDAAKKLDEFLKISTLWQLFKKRIQKNDELWFFRSDVDSWRKNDGKEGYCIVRRKKNVEFTQDGMRQKEIPSIVSSFLITGKED